MKGTALDFLGHCSQMTHPSINIELNKALDTIRSMGGIVIDPADLPNAQDISGARTCSQMCGYEKANWS
jgi:hypothetical protein